MAAGNAGPHDNGCLAGSERQLYPIPTRFELKEDGSSEAILHSLSAGTIAFITHQVRVADVSFHWSKDAVDDLASRMILNGTGLVEGGTDTNANQPAAIHFEPNAQVSRAEFAAMIVRALGLDEVQEGAPAFRDVDAEDWHGGVITQAVQYGLLQGYEDGRFRPNQGITRQEAIAVMASDEAGGNNECSE